MNQKWKWDQNSRKRTKVRHSILRTWSSRRGSRRRSCSPTSRSVATGQGVFCVFYHLLRNSHYIIPCNTSQHLRCEHFYGIWDVKISTYQILRREMINKISKNQSSTTCSWATNYNPQVSGEFQLQALEEPRIWCSHSTTDLKRICSSSFFLYIITLCWHDAIAQNKTNKSRLQPHCTRGFPAYIDWLPLSP